MAITLTRQLSNAEKEQILKVHGRVCYATGHPIRRDDTVEFDHIRAFSKDGPSEPSNIAPMCQEHNKAKGALPLEDFRVSLKLKEFFSQGDALTLRHLLDYLKKNQSIKGFGQAVILNSSDGRVAVEAADGSHRSTSALHKCPTTGWNYFYATLPIELLNSDDEDEEKVGLQPRYLIYDKVFGLYRHFQIHPVLQPSIGRVHGKHIVLFDGQHKIAALLWTGRRKFECKIYLDPELRLLNQTNIAAHDNFSQTRFFASIMVARLGTEFGNDFERYKQLEDGMVKSESGFLRYLEQDPTQMMTKAERNKRFRSYLYNAALQHPENRLVNYLSQSNRSTDEKPLTIDQLSKSIFSNFLYAEPVDDNMATDSYKRDREIENIVALMNIVHDLGLHAWNPKAGNDLKQLRLRRLFGSKPMLAWSELLSDAVCGKLDLNDSEDRERPFYRDLTDSDLEKVKKIVERLLNHKVWSSPANSEVDRVASDNKSAIKTWLKNQGLTTGYLLGAKE